jgi:hypothetical protein
VPIIGKQLGHASLGCGLQVPQGLVTQVVTRMKSAWPAVLNRVLGFGCKGVAGHDSRFGVEALASDVAYPTPCAALVNRVQS